MIPIEKVKLLLTKHQDIEKELSSGKLDAVNFKKKSKEYSELNEIVPYARKYLNFEKEKKDLDNIVNDKAADKEMILLAKKELAELISNKDINENKIKIFLLPKDEDDNKNAIVEIKLVQGVLRQHYSALIYLKCTKRFVPKKIGKWKLLIFQKVTQADLKK